MADTADLVVLGGYYGTGAYGNMISVFLMGCRDEHGKWRTVCKCGNGPTDAMLAKINRELDTVKISKDREKVPSWLVIKSTDLVPDFVVRDPKAAPVWEITGAEFSTSTRHSADNISIRFPRMTRIRDDKDWESATTLAELKRLRDASKASVGKEDEEEGEEDEQEGARSDEEEEADVVGRKKKVPGGDESDDDTGLASSAAAAGSAAGSKETSAGAGASKKPAASTAARKAPSRSLATVASAAKRRPRRKDDEDEGDDEENDEDRAFIDDADYDDEEEDDGDYGRRSRYDDDDDDDDDEVHGRQSCR